MPNNNTTVSDVEGAKEDSSNDSPSFAKPDHTPSIPRRSLRSRDSSGPLHVSRYRIVTALFLYQESIAYAGQEIPVAHIEAYSVVGLRPGYDGPRRMLG